MHLLLIAITALLSFSDAASAGGAVMKRQQAGKQKAQMQAQAQAQMQAQRQAQLQAAQMQAAQMQAAQVQATQIQAQRQAAAIAATGTVTAQATVHVLEDSQFIDSGDVLESLRRSAQVWPQIVNPEDKVAVVQQFIDEAQQTGVRIQKPAALYAGMIDEMSQGDSRMLELPFEQILRVVTIMEYDYDNGSNKDALARQVLGPQVYESNRKRLGLQQ